MTPKRSYQTDLELGDRALLPFAGQAGLRIGLIGAGATVFMVIMWYMLTSTVMSLDGDTSFGVDFIVYWSAAQLALEGNAVEAFNLESLEAIHQVENSAWLPWLYPPGYLILLMPLGALPFMPAFITYNTVSSLALIAAVRPLASKATGVWIGVALAPTTLAAYVLGQTPILWAAGLVAALGALGRGKEILAGVFIGLLTLKPQLGLLIPVALIAAGHWRTILSAALTTIALVVIGTLAFGMAYWSEFFAIGREHYDWMRTVIGDRDQMISLYSGLVYIGVPENIAFAGQMLGLVLAALGIFLAWRSDLVGFDLKAAMLFAGILVSSPYMWHYEAAFLAPLLLFLLRAGVLRPRGPDLTVGFLLWVGVGPVMVASILFLGSEIPIRPFVTPILLLAFAVTLWAVMARVVLRRSQRGI